MTTFRRIGGLIVAGWLAGAGAPATAGITVADDGGSAFGSYLAGRFAQNQNDWGSAAQFMTRALSADPDDASLVRRTFLLKLGEGEYDAASALAERVAEVDSGAPFAVLLLASDRLLAGRVGDARDLVGRLPDDGIARFVAPLAKAWLASAAGKPDDAIAALRPLLEANGFKALHDLHAGLILEQAGRIDTAAGYFATVAGDDPPLRVAQVVGGFYERRGKTEDARRLYEAVRDRNPENAMIEPALAGLDAGRTAPPSVATAAEGLAEALFDLGSAIHHEGSADTALLFGRLALRLRPDFALARLMIGDILASRDQGEAALAEYRPLQDDPTFGWPVRLRMAEAQAAMDRTDDAIATLARLAADRPERSDAAVRLGDLYRSANRWAEAADAYSTALARIGTLGERHWAILYARAIAYDKLDHWTEAEADLKSALTLRPDEPFVLNYLGYSWVDKGTNLAEAKTMVERAVSLRPRDGYIVDSLGWALYRLGDYEEAVKRLERAVELKPLDATINDHLGDAYWRVGRRGEARFQWERALRTAEEDALKDQIRAKLDSGLPDRKTAGTDGPEVR